MENLVNVLSGICYSLSGLINPIENSFNYNKNTNKPTINNVVLSGNLKSEDLGLITPQNFLSASLPVIEFDPTQVFVLNSNNYNRDLSHEPAVFVYNSDGFDITALASIQWNNNTLTVDVTQLDSFNVALTGLFKIKFAEAILYNKSEQDIPKTLITLNTTSFIPQNNTFYQYDIQGNETFTFNTPINSNEIINFRLYLTTPSSVVSFTLPSGIIWEDEIDLTETNSLYMFVFEWNPVLNKWLGNQMWQPITIPIILYYNIQVSVDKDYIYDDKYNSYNIYANSPRILTYNASSITWGTTKMGIIPALGINSYEYGANFYIDDGGIFSITNSGPLPIPSSISVVYDDITFTFTPIPVYAE